MTTEGTVLGIDVGWSDERQSSAVCRLDWSARQIQWKTARYRAISPEREDTIRHLADESELLAVAIDGPLRRRFDVIGRYRSAERLLSRGILPRHIGKPGQSNSPHGRKLNAEANRVAIFVKRCCLVSKAMHAVRVDDRAIVEAFPTTFLGSMVERPARVLGGRRSDRYFAHLAELRRFEPFVHRLLSGRKWIREPRDIENHDDRAAFVCALTALSVAAGEFAAVGDDNDGWIILPPRWAFADWAWTAVCATARNEALSQGSASGRLLSFSEHRPTRYC